MFNFILNLFKKPYSPGLAKDTRSQSEKEKDFQHEEIAYGVAPVTWIEKPVSAWIKGEVRDQNGSSSCVMQGIAKGREMSLGKVFSARTYCLRPNYPGAGMWLQSGGDIQHNIGAFDEYSYPSQKMTEAQMNVKVSFPEGKKAKYVFVAPKDIDTIAQVIRDYKHCVLTFESNYQEWTDVPHYLGTPIQWGHCVCATDFTLYNGEKALIIDESWGVGVTQFNAQRVITKSFLQARCTGAMYFIEPSDIVPVKPSYTFARDLVYGMTKDEDVKKLQDALAYFGYFPTDPQYHTGNYFQMTSNAVLKWQRANAVASSYEIETLGGKRFGFKSRTKMNLLLL